MVCNRWQSVSANYQNASSPKTPTPPTGVVPFYYKQNLSHVLCHLSPVTGNQRQNPQQQAGPLPKSLTMDRRLVCQDTNVCLVRTGLLAKNRTKLNPKTLFKPSKKKFLSVHFHTKSLHVSLGKSKSHTYYLY